MSETLDRTLRVAETVVEALRAEGADAVVIGAVALAVHGYPRSTTDLDLAVSVRRDVLHRVADALAAHGYAVSVRDPDAADPRGGVIDVRSQGADLVHVVNFDNRPSGGFPRLVDDALAEALPLTGDGVLKVVDPYHLVAFKLYARGPKSTNDIIELLERNPGLDRARLRAMCKTYRLEGALDRILRQLAEETGSG
ncbi:MAG: hypothetical protein FJ087_00925 [Deltaproteobacteria bacterium]|nr:hypothetical protein [Deltaproteobacteria bacterium]